MSVCVSYIYILLLVYYLSIINVVSFLFWSDRRAPKRLYLLEHHPSQLASSQRPNLLSRRRRRTSRSFASNCYSSMTSSPSSSSSYRWCSYFSILIQPPATEVQRISARASTNHCVQRRWIHRGNLQQCTFARSIVHPIETSFRAYAFAREQTEVGEEV